MSLIISILFVISSLITVYPSEVFCKTKISQDQGHVWALLVAGSSGYGNYRHQADICHAYQILRRNGILEDHIIVMMSDDIAYNTKNPTPGIIINKPNGKDVYKGVQKDYIGENVTPQNFLRVLSGNKTVMNNIGTGRVIESGLNDVIFLNFADHGAPGMVFFPNDTLNAKHFVTALQNLASQKKFAQMFIFVEACHSGSMFDDLLADDLNIFVMTASDGQEASYATYYDKVRETFLGDLFSVNWMEEAEKENLMNSSFHHLFEKVRFLTESKSHVEEYGDLDVGSTKLSNIIGSNPTNKLFTDDYNIFDNPLIDATSVSEVHVSILQRKLESSDSAENTRALQKQLQLVSEKRKVVDTIMDKIVTKLSRKNKFVGRVLRKAKYPVTKKILDCYDEVTNKFSDICFNIPKNPYVAKSLQILVNACSIYWRNPQRIIHAMNYSCKNVNKIVDTV